MHWNISNRVQIVEDYMTLELRMNWIRDYDGIYTQHEADCETLMFIINRWNERKTEAGKKIWASRARFNPGASKKSAQLLASYMDDYREAKMCYEYNLRELDHLIQHNSTHRRIHFIYERDRVGMCDQCDEADAVNEKHYHDYQPLYTARHTNEDLTVSMRHYVRCTKCDFVSYTVNA